MIIPKMHAVIDWPVIKRNIVCDTTILTVYACNLTCFVKSVMDLRIDLWFITTLGGVDLVVHLSTNVSRLDLSGHTLSSIINIE